MRLSFDQAGHGGPPIVLIHGFPLDRRIWFGVIFPLSVRVRVIAPDLPGFGRSPGGQPFTIPSLADDLHGFLAEQNALPCHLAGLSMGGYVALAFAEKYPADLVSLSLIDTRAEADTLQGKQARDEMINLARLSGSAAIAHAMLPKLVAPTTKTERLLPILLDCPSLTIQHALAAMRDRRDYMPVLPRLKIPVQVIAGELDAITPPAVARAMAAAAANGRVTIIPAAGHLTPYEAPAAVASALLYSLQ